MWALIICSVVSALLVSTPAHGSDFRSNVIRSFEQRHALRADGHLLQWRMAEKNTNTPLAVDGENPRRMRNEQYMAVSTPRALWLATRSLRKRGNAGLRQHNSRAENIDGGQVAYARPSAHPPSTVQSAPLDDQSPSKKDRAKTASQLDGGGRGSGKEKGTGTKTKPCLEMGTLKSGTHGGDDTDGIDPNHDVLRALRMVRKKCNSVTLPRRDLAGPP